MRGGRGKKHWAQTTPNTKNKRGKKTHSLELAVGAQADARPQRWCSQAGQSRLRLGSLAPVAAGVSGSECVGCACD